MSDPGYTPTRKGSLLIISGPVEHLYFICNDPVFFPAKASDCFLAVNITSIKPEIQHDTTCVVVPGDHPFVVRPSYAYYEKAEIFGAETTRRRVATGDYKTHHSCSDQLIDRVIAGFTTSPFVSPKIRKYAEKYCFGA